MFVEEATAIKNTVTQAIQKAAQATGVDFGYLMKTAHRESGPNLSPTAKAATSSATGTFQFIESTWLQMVKEEGAGIGLGHYANAITKTDSGYSVNNPATKAEILSLRNDPETASLMAARFTQKNAGALSDEIGRTPTSGELYMAHVLGAGGAAKLINAVQDNPNTAASAIFPREAGANAGIFYSGGSARSVAEVYAALTKGHENIGTGNVLSTAVVRAQTLETPITAYAALRKTNAPMFHTMTVAGKPSVKMVTAYLPSFTHRDESAAGATQSATHTNARNAAYGYQRKVSGNNFFSNLVQPAATGAPFSLSQVI